METVIDVPMHSLGFIVSGKENSCDEYLSYRCAVRIVMRISYPVTNYHMPTIAANNWDT